MQELRKLHEVEAGGARGIVTLGGDEEDNAGGGVADGGAGARSRVVDLDELFLIGHADLAVFNEHGRATDGVVHQPRDATGGKCGRGHG